MKKIISLCLLLLMVSCSKSPTPPQYIGIDPTWYPLYVEGKDKNIYGFSIELLQVIAKKQNIPLSTKLLPWDDVISSLEKHEVKAVLSSLPDRIYNDKKFSFSKPYLLTGPVLVIPSSSRSSSLQDMAGLEVAIITGSQSAKILEKVPTILIRDYPNIPSALNAILAQDVDGALIEVLYANSYVKDLYRDALKIASDPLTDQGFRLLTLTEGSKHLEEAFDKGLESLEASGELEKLKKKWGL